MDMANAKARVLSLVRRGAPVAWCPSWMRLGNLLYLGLWAEAHPGARFLLHPEHAELLERVAPRMATELCVPRSRVPFTAQRVMPWKLEDRGEWFEPSNLQEFIESYVLPGSEIARTPALSGAFVVNIRRGDYYSVPQYRAEFGMGQIAYVSRAVEESIRRNGCPERFVVISDDPSWSREHIGPVLRRYARVEHPEGDAVRDLAVLAGAERLLLPNTTFSYWGGYIGDVLRPGREVIAPWFWARGSQDGRSHQLRRHWTVVGDSAPAEDEIDE